MWVEAHRGRRHKQTQMHTGGHVEQKRTVYNSVVGLFSFSFFFLANLDQFPDRVKFVSGCLALIKLNSFFF